MGNKLKLLFSLFFVLSSFKLLADETTTKLTELTEKAPTEKVKKEKTINIRTSPFLFLISSYNFNAEIKVAKSFTVGPVYRHFGMFDSNSDLFSLGFQTMGVQGKYYFSGEAFKDSFYIEAEIFAVEAKLKFLGDELDGIGGPNFSSAIGYHFFWDSGINLNLGAGAMTAYTFKKVSPILDINVGFAF